MIVGYKILLWIGISVILVQFLGIPSLWKETILFLAGIILIAQYFFIKNNNA
jgi:hypothetical protein